VPLNESRRGLGQELPMRKTTMILGVLLFAAACGSDDGTSTNPLEIQLETGSFEVPVGDSFTCFYTDTYSDREVSVYAATGSQGLGGHHIIAYYAEQERPVGYHPCVDEEMTNLHQIAGSSGLNNETPPIELRDGLALKVAAGKQFVLQAHYINATDAPETVNDQVTLKLMQPEDVFAYVNYFVTNDDSFDIPATASYSHTTYCTVERDLDIVLTLGHMHEAGRHYQLDVVDGTDTVMQNLRSDEWAASFSSHPPVSYYPVAAPLHLAAGTRLRQTCDWDNVTTREELFPREMCLSFMYYFPGTGSDITCQMTAQ
jgi:hypothetical protein